MGAENRKGRSGRVWCPKITLASATSAVDVSGSSGTHGPCRVPGVDQPSASRGSSFLGKDPPSCRCGFCANLLGGAVASGQDSGYFCVTWWCGVDCPTLC